MSESALKITKGTSISLGLVMTVLLGGSSMGLLQFYSLVQSSAAQAERAEQKVEDLQTKLFDEFKEFNKNIGELKGEVSGLKREIELLRKQQ